MAIRSFRRKQVPSWRFHPVPLLLLLLLLLPFLYAAQVTTAVVTISHRCIHADARLQEHIHTNWGTLSQSYSTDEGGMVPRHLNERHQERTKWTSPVLGGKSQLIRLNLERDGQRSANKKGERTKGKVKETTAKWEPIRIVVDTSHLTDPKKICTAVGQVRPDFMGSTHTCTAQDIMTVEKLWFIENIALPLALYRTQRLFNVNPVQGPLLVSPGVCGPDVTVSDDHISVGVADADMILYAHAGGMGSSTTSGVAGTVAWAGACTLDQFGRPVVGQINFVPSFIEWQVSGWEYEYYVRVVMHEMFHALGYTPTILNTMVNVSKRRGKKVKIVTAPAVVSAARKHLGCPTLDGVELEDEGGTGTAGTHWERRQWMDELMAGVPSRSAISELSLAFFSSTSIYTVNMQYAEPMGWSHNAGCAFVEEACTANATAMGVMWCNESVRTQACTYDRTEVGICDVGIVLGLPPYFQYSPDNPFFGGLTPLMDFCPVVVGYVNRQCRDPSQASDDDSIYGLYFGPQSRCVPTTNMMRIGFVFEDSSPRCLRVRCQMGTRLEIFLGHSWLSCPSDGSAGDISIPLSSGFSGKIHCERAELVCSPELFYNPNARVSELGPAREYALDVVVVLNTTASGAKVISADVLGRIAVQAESFFFVDLQQDIADLCSYDLGAGSVRMLPEHAFASIDGGGVVVYFQLGVMAGMGGTKLDIVRAECGAALAVGSVMRRIGAHVTLASDVASTTTVTASEILPDAKIVDGFTSLQQLVSLGDVTLHCGGDLSGVPSLANGSVTALLATAAKEDISKLILVTANLVQVRGVRISGPSELVLSATVAFPPAVDDAGGVDEILHFWSRRLTEALASASPFPLLTSAVALLSKGAPVSLADGTPENALTLRSATVGQTQPESSGDPRCAVKFTGCFPVQIVVLAFIILIALTLIIIFVVAFLCPKLARHASEEKVYSLVVPLQPKDV
ncbi:surface protease GP63 [Trypanosoma grayi]|uniref:surface protease GP63 n=1 Tax=Trypanosoma grayi TaxID=71804 RepID=UPI0004F42C53|nr:surface protease GP63 [Trypanosoma grayi]KEG10703.1 surface protease GP63 [Trypanosoma grayi]